jgi:hypothetical protein
MRDEFLAKFLVTTGYYGVFDNIWLARKNDNLIHQIQSGELKALRLRHVVPSDGDRT